MNEWKVVAWKNLKYIFQILNTNFLIIFNFFFLQWFGNIISPSWWNEAYLFDGFSSYFASQLLDDLYPDWKFEEISLYRDRQTGMRRDASQYAKPLSDEWRGGVFPLSFDMVSQKVISISTFVNFIHTGTARSNLYWVALLKRKA